MEIENKYTNSSREVKNITIKNDGLYEKSWFFDHENKMFSSIALKFGSDTTFFIRGNYFLHDFLPNNKV